MLALGDHSHHSAEAAVVRILESSISEYDFCLVRLRSALLWFFFFVRILGFQNALLSVCETLAHCNSSQHAQLSKIATALRLQPPRQKSIGRDLRSKAPLI